MIQLHDKEFDIYIPTDELNLSVESIAREINADYQGKNPVFLAVLNGAFMFASDLLKKININCEIQFVKLSSYEGTSSTGQVKSLIGIPKDLKEKDVILLEDIVDTGNTIQELYKALENKGLNSLKTASLLLKPEAYNNLIPIDYVGKEIPNEFVVGYGLDYDGLGRNLKDLYKIKN